MHCKSRQIPYSTSSFYVLSHYIVQRQHILCTLYCWKVCAQYSWLLFFVSLLLGSGFQEYMLLDLPKHWEKTRQTMFSLILLFTCLIVWFGLVLPYNRIGSKPHKHTKHLIHHLLIKPRVEVHLNTTNYCSKMRISSPFQTLLQHTEVSWVLLSLQNSSWWGCLPPLSPSFHFL